MSTSPSLRLSLRRKRSTRSTDNGGSPSIKKKSPTLPEPKKEPPITPKSCKPSRSSNRLSRSGSRRSPRKTRVPTRRSTKEKDETEDSEQKPTQLSTPWTHSSRESLRQPSPDMPFTSSQFCSSQECEVVWDCDSPGFTKEDLKRMHGGGDAEGPVKPVPVHKYPHRRLFPFTRSRAAKPSTSANTTAQLNDLLDLLLSKKDQSGRNKNEENVNSPQTLEPLIPPGELITEDSYSSESQTFPDPLREALSQPFDVLCAADNRESDRSLPLENDNSLWGDDLNMGMCDINDSLLTQQESNITNTKSSAGNGDGAAANKETERSRMPQETTDISSASVDIFDDDLFSDSVILSTQAVEEAMTKDTKDITNDKETSHTYKVKDGQQYRDKDCDTASSHVRNANMNCNKLGVVSHKMISSNSTTGKAAFPKALSSFNVAAIKSNSESSPQRKVRRSFRFGSSPKSSTTTKSPPPLLSEGGSQSLLNHVPANTNYINNREGNNLPGKSYAIPLVRPGKPSSTIQNLSTSNLLSNELSRPSSTASRTNLINTQLTKGPIVKNSLFKSNTTKSEDVKTRGSIQGGRGSFPRSQSSADTRINTSSPVARRSNSSVELDSSQDLDDDEFFKSLLSMMPDDEVLSANSLSPIMSGSQSPTLQRNVKTPANVISLIGNRIETRGSSSSKKETDIVPTHNSNNRKNVHSQNTNSAPLQNPHNTLVQRLPTATAQNLCKRPPQNHNFPYRNSTGVSSQNPYSQNHKIGSHSLYSAPSQRHASFASQNMPKSPPQNLNNVAWRGAGVRGPQSKPNAPQPMFGNRSVASKSRQANHEVRRPPVDSSVKKPASSLVQGVKTSGGGSYSSVKVKPPNTSKTQASGSKQQQQQQSSDTFDDGLFEGDVLSLIDEVESQFGSQNAPSEPSCSPLSSQPKCTQDEIAKKKAAALKRREERRRQQRR